MKTYLKLTALFLLITLSLSCAESSRLSSLKNKKYLSNLNHMQYWMVDYMKSAGHPYSKKDVNECVYILVDYLNGMELTKSKEEGMKLVESTIVKLNNLNAKCGGELIETSQREQIAEIIIGASSDKGYNSLDEDITWGYREW